MVSGTGVTCDRRVTESVIMTASMAEHQPIQDAGVWEIYDNNTYLLAGKLLILIGYLQVG